MYSASATLRMEPSDVAPRRARRCVRALCGEELPTDRLETVLLLVSELTTNAYRHGAGVIVLTLTCDFVLSDVVITVSDDSSEMPFRQPDDLASDGGRGLQLLEALSTAWGVLSNDAADGVAKTVWFQVDGHARAQ